MVVALTLRLTDQFRCREPLAGKWLVPLIFMYRGILSLENIYEGV